MSLSKFRWNSSPCDNPFWWHYTLYLGAVGPVDVGMWEWHVYREGSSYNREYVIFWGEGDSKFMWVVAKDKPPASFYRRIADKFGHDISDGVKQIITLFAPPPLDAPLREEDLCP